MILCCCFSKFSPHVLKILFAVNLFRCFVFCTRVSTKETSLLSMILCLTSKMTIKTKHLPVLQAQGVDCLDVPGRDTEDRRGCGKRDKVIVLQPFVWRRAK